MTPGEVRRLYFIIRTFLSYGLDELIPKMRITLPLRRSEEHTSELQSYA